MFTSGHPSQSNKKILTGALKGALNQALIIVVGGYPTNPLSPAPTPSNENISQFHNNMSFRRSVGRRNGSPPSNNNMTQFQNNLSLARDTHLSLIIFIRQCAPALNQALIIVVRLILHDYPPGPAPMRTFVSFITIIPSYRTLQFHWNMGHFHNNLSFRHSVGKRVKVD